jgi:hypothetical protein
LPVFIAAFCTISWNDFAGRERCAPAQAGKSGHLHFTGTESIGRTKTPVARGPDEIGAIPLTPH